MDVSAQYPSFDQGVAEKLFQLLVASVSDYAIFMIDPNGYVMSWNQGAEHIQGYSRAEIIGTHISVFYTPEDIKNNIPHYNLSQALKKGSHCDEGWRIKKNGDSFLANVVFTAINNESGNLIGFAAISRDITESKAAEDEKAKDTVDLKEQVNSNATRIIANQLRFRKLIENSYDGLALYDENFNVIYRSLSAERISGWNYIERTSYAALALTHPDDQEQVKNLFTEILSKPGISILATYRTKHKSGHYIWIECVYTNMLTDENINAVVCNFRDITEQKRADEEIRKKTEQIENVFERITDGFIALDNNFCCTYANKKIGEMTGIDPADLLGKCVWDVFPEAVNSETYKAFHKALAEQHYVFNEDYFAPLDLWQENHIYPSATGLSVFVRDVSKRIKTELKLEQNEQRFRQLLENSNDIVVVTAFDGTITYISPNAQKTLGHNLKALNLEQRANMLHPDDREPYRRLFAEVRETPGKIYPFTHRIKKASGEYLWVEGTIINLLHVPAVNGMVTNSRDITDRKNKEQQIEVSHAQLRQAADTQAAILNALPSHIVLLNEEYRIIAVNQSWKNMALANNLGLPNFGVGYSYLAIVEQAAGVSKHDADKLAKSINNVISGSKKQFSIEYLSNHKGEKKWFMVTVAPLANHEQKGVVVSHLDITDRKRAQESQLKSEDNMRSVFENTDLSVVLLDDELKIASFNNNAQRLSIRNYHKKLKVGNIAFNYFSKNRKNSVKRILDRVKQNETVSYESAFKTDDGAIEWYDIKWIGVTNKQLETIGYIMTLKDITGKKRAEMEREQITADLLKRNNDLEQYAYIVSHNLRAPVANIMGLSSLLNAMEPTAFTDHETLEALSLSINNLDRVINDLNQILQVGNQVNNPTEPVLLSQLVDDIKAGNRLVITSNNATIIGNFSAIAELKTVKSYLYSIFQNLIINSIKYHRADVDPVISIGTEIRGKMVLISFEDNGKGIDLAKYGTQLFGLYKRFDTAVEGRGIGLFMVKKQVENLGGKISVQSELNKGTRFVIELPV